MEVPRLGVESELQLLAYTTAIATRDLSHVCNLHHSSWPQHWILFFFFFFLSFVLLGPPPWHMEVPRLGVESELQLLAYTTAIATLDPRRVCDLYHSPQQCWTLNPLSEARDQTRNLMVPSRIRFCCATRGTPLVSRF